MVLKVATVVAVADGVRVDVTGGEWVDSDNDGGHDRVVGIYRLKFKCYRMCLVTVRVGFCSGSV